MLINWCLLFRLLNYVSIDVFVYLFSRNPVIPTVKNLTVSLNLYMCLLLSTYKKSYYKFMFTTSFLYPHVKSKSKHNMKVSCKSNQFLQKYEPHRSHDINILGHFVFLHAAG